MWQAKVIGLMDDATLFAYLHRPAVLATSGIIGTHPRFWNSVVLKEAFYYLLIITLIFTNPNYYLFCAHCLRYFFDKNKRMTFTLILLYNLTKATSPSLFMMADVVYTTLTSWHNENIPHTYIVSLPHHVSYIIHPEY